MSIQCRRDLNNATICMFLSYLKHALVPNNVALKMKRCVMSFRTNLEVHRDPKHLRKLLQMVVEGFQQMHDIYFVNKDIKPENIGVSLKPLCARIISFDIANPIQLATVGTIIGIGCYPNFINLKNQNTPWDVWAVAALIFDSDMQPGLYRTVSSKRERIIFKLNRHHRPLNDWASQQVSQQNPVRDQR